MLYLWIYLIGFMAAWILVLTKYVQYEFDGDTKDMDIEDWAIGAMQGLGAGFVWPFIALALIPISIVNHAAKNGGKR